MNKLASFIIILLLTSIQLSVQNSLYKWVKTLGGSNADQIQDIVIRNNNNLYITDSFYQTVDADPGAGITKKLL
tara:strand:+ start:13685 stop:13906 length:222 start_codon:yes stop_codon:yes gene_type:complete